MSQVFYSTAAKQDVRDIHDYIAADNADAAERLLLDIEATCERLLRFPNSGLSRDDLLFGLRLTVVRKKYVIFYRAHAKDIEIIRVAHGARDYAKLFDL